MGERPFDNSQLARLGRIGVETRQLDGRGVVVVRPADGIVVVIQNGGAGAGSAAARAHRAGVGRRIVSSQARPNRHEVTTIGQIGPLGNRNEIHRRTPSGLHFGERVVGRIEKHGRSPLGDRTRRDVRGCQMPIIIVIENVVGGGEVDERTGVVVDFDPFPSGSGRCRVVHDLGDSQTGSGQHRPAACPACRHRRYY